MSGGPSPSPRRVAKISPPGTGTVRLVNPIDSSVCERPCARYPTAPLRPFDPREVLLVVIDREPEEARDVEPAVRRVRPEPRPAGFIERPDRGDRPGPPPGEHGQDLEERGILEARGETRLGPRPVRIVLLCEPRQARPPDLVLDGDEVTDDLVRAPLAVRDRPPLRGACLGCRRRAGRGTRRTSRPGRRARPPSRSRPSGERLDLAASPRLGRLDRVERVQVEAGDPRRRDRPSAAPGPRRSRVGL